MRTAAVMLRSLLALKQRSDRNDIGVEYEMVSILLACPTAYLRYRHRKNGLRWHRAILERETHRSSSDLRIVRCHQKKLPDAIVQPCRGRAPELCHERPSEE